MGRFSLVILLAFAMSSCIGKVRTDNEPPVRRFADIKPGRQALWKQLSSFGHQINYVTRDSKGRYWFAERGEGLFCFDGKEVRQYTTKDGLISDDITDITEDSQGRMCFGTQDGISMHEAGKFITLKPIESEHNEWKLEKNDLWFRGNWSENAVYRFDGKELFLLRFPKHRLEDEFNALYPNANFSPYGIYSLSRDSKGNMWFGTANFGAVRFDGEEFLWIDVLELRETEDGAAPGVRAIIEDKHGDFWLGNLMHRYKILEKDPLAGREHASYEMLEGKEAGSLSSQYLIHALNDPDRGCFWYEVYPNEVGRTNEGAGAYINLGADQFIVFISEARGSKVEPVILQRIGSEWHDISAAVLDQFIDKKDH